MEKLYEAQPYLTHFSATVESCTQGKKGWDILLDQTAFYPEGGGQPYDTGTLGGVPVLEVHQREGRVVHTCAAPLEAGSQVEGQIDWPRRFDLMQHHSGEHIVSGIAHCLYGCDNVGFHMGSDVITIDLNVELTPEQVAQLEARANQYIWEDHPIAVTYPTPQELEVLEYRSKKALTGQVRIVSFPGADTCACCGTHVFSSGQVGLVKLLSCQKFRDGVRIELVCGKRALDYLSQVWEQNHQISNLLSAKTMQTSGAVRRLLDETPPSSPAFSPWRSGSLPLWPSGIPAKGMWWSLKKACPPTACAVCAARYRPHAAGAAPASPERTAQVINMRWASPAETCVPWPRP